MAVANTEPFGYNTTGIEFKEVYLKPIYTDARINTLFNVIPGIASKATIPLDSEFEKIVRSAPDCDTDTEGADINVDSAVLEVCELGFDRFQCMKDFYASFRQEYLKLDANGMTKDEYLKKYIEDKFKQAMLKDTFRIAMLGDISSSDPDYNQCDGIWKQIFALVGSYGIERVTISHAAVLAAGTSIAAAGTFLQYFKDLYYGASAAFKAAEVSKKRFLVTGSIYDALDQAYDVLRANNGYIEGLQKAGDKLTFKGIEVYPLYSLDGYIETDLGGTYPDRIIYYHKDAIAIGMDGESDDENLEILEDKVGKRLLYRGFYRMGVKILFPDFVRVAY